MGDRVRYNDSEMRSHFIDRFVMLLLNQIIVALPSSSDTQVAVFWEGVPVKDREESDVMVEMRR